MKVVTVWQNSGFITLVRDSEGSVRPQRKIPVSESIALHTPFSTQIELEDIVIPEGIVCFIDSLDENLDQSKQRLNHLLEHASDSNLLIVTAADSIERKRSLAEFAVNLSKRLAFSKFHFQSHA